MNQRCYNCMDAEPWCELHKKTYCVHLCSLHTATPRLLQAARACLVPLSHDRPKSSYLVELVEAIRQAEGRG